MDFSLKRISKALGFFIAMAVLFSAVFFLASWRKSHILWASIVLDEHQHYYDCYELPFYPEAEKALKNHSDVLEKLKDAGASEIKAKEIKCKGFDQGLMFVKGEIEIHYSSHKERLAIEKIIGDNFFGVVYRGVKK